MPVESFSSYKDYIESLLLRSSVPKGFSFATDEISFIPKELLNKNKPQKISIATILAPQPTTSWAASLTSNRFVGAPIDIIRDYTRNNTPIRGIVINNKIANVGITTGKKDQTKLLDSYVDALEIRSQKLLPASTGIIGWSLPVKELVSLAPSISKKLHFGQPLQVAKAIMTTDAYPKIRSQTLPSGHKILAIAKGAGMIQPNLATMLVFILTDVPANNADMQKVLTEAVKQSFNCITVDGDQSTSDMAVILSSSVQKAPITSEIESAVKTICIQLANDIVRNGEGTHHVIKITITSPFNNLTAINIGKAIANSPLVKTAIYGNDPNVGRIVSALGDYLGSKKTLLSYPFQQISIRLGNHLIFEAGSFHLDSYTEQLLKNYLKDCSFDTSQGYPPHNRDVEISINFPQVNNFNNATKTVNVVGSDLSHDYITENADYRT